MLRLFLFIIIGFNSVYFILLLNCSEKLSKVQTKLVWVESKEESIWVKGWTKLGPTKGQVELAWIVSQAKSVWTESRVR